MPEHTVLLPTRLARTAKVCDYLLGSAALPSRRLGLEALEERQVPDGRPLPLPVIFAGAGEGTAPVVQAYSAETGALSFERAVYNPGFTGGVRVAAGDFTADGFPDVVVAPGPGGGAAVRVLDGKTGEQVPGPVGGFIAYDSAFPGGVFVAAADMDGDQTPDVVTAAGAHVRVFSGATGAVLADFTATDPEFASGVTVAAADLTGDGKAEVILGAATGGPLVGVFDPLTGLPVPGPLGSFYAFDPATPGGVFVGADALAGDMDDDGTPDLAVGSGPGTAPRVKVFSGKTGAVLVDFAPFGAGATGGVRVALAYVTDDPYADVVAGSGPGTVSTVRVFDGQTGGQLAGAAGEYIPFGGATGGAFVAASNDPPRVGFDWGDDYPGFAFYEGDVTNFSLFRSDTSGYLTVSFGATPGTADEGSDYVFISSYTFQPGQQVAYPLAVLGLYDGLVEPDETFSFYILPSDTYTRHPNEGGAGHQIDFVIHDRSSPPTGYAAIISGCECPPTLVSSAAGTAAKVAEGVVPAVSAKPVRYADGTVKLTRYDLASAGVGAAWGQTRSWTNGSGYAAAQGNGDGWVVSQQPRLLPVNGTSTLAVVGDGLTAWFFDLTGGVYVARFGGAERLVYDAGTDTYTMTTGTGNRITFAGFGTSYSELRRGQFEGMTTAGGAVTQVTSWTSLGRIAEVRATAGGVTESYQYAYVASGVNLGLLTSVALRRSTDGGTTWVQAGSVAYTYYAGLEANGNARDLKTAVVLDAAGAAVSTDYYRYYTVGGAGAYKHGLKYAVLGASYDRLKAAAGGTDAAVFAAADGTLAGYADHYFEYDAFRRVTEEVASGAGCSVCAGGQGRFGFAYTASANSAGYNSWARKTLETLPDGNTNTVYTNAYGQVMLKAYTDTSTSQVWVDYYRYDGSGRLVLHAQPTAVTGYSDGYADLVNYVSGNATYLSDTSGLLTAYAYGSTTTATASAAGEAAGYLRGVDLLHGETGTLGNGRLAPLSAQTYLMRTVFGHDFYFPATSTVYENTDGTGALTTTAAYTWQGSTAQPASVTISVPTVSAGRNGSGTATSVTTVYDPLGRPVWEKDAAGSIRYTQYDARTGAIVKVIADVDTDLSGDFSGVPSGWSSPAGLHRVIQYEVDDQGRVVKVTYPGGRVDYTVYDDANRETRYYPAWDSISNAPTGPTTVTRTDRAKGYNETLTMSAVPAVSGGRPTGAENISGLLTLSRSYMNAAGQVTHADAYFDLSGLTYSTSTSLGTSGTNFYRTSYAYDQQGLQNKVVSPLGTINRTEYDGQGRAVSEWVGTDDTPTTGYWSVTNLTGTNMVKVRAYEYDGGGVGDGLLTKVTEFPGGGAADRVTETHYDWRGRAVATKSGVESSESTSANRPITYTDYDNLGRVIRTRVYDGDGVTISTTSGVPDAPSSSLLRAQSTTSYDELGRAYRTDVYSVDPTSGTVGSNTLHSQTWYDAAGRVVKSTAPGGLVAKTAYDGLGRVTMRYTTDGGGDSGYTDADDVSGDIVLEQSQPQYDAAGNVVLVTTWQRHHDASGTGVLDGGSGPAARRSFAGYYYDMAGRQIAVVDIGTSPGTVYAWPSTPPASTDDVLVSGVTYDAAGRVYEATDPRGVVTRTLYDALGRAVKTVQNYVDGTVSDADDKTTEYTYNAAGMTSLTAKLTGGGGQTTEWVYGVTTGGGSGITSNDVVRATRWPDAATGAASSSEQEAVTVNALGQTVTSTDRNGNVHTLSYDVLGRVVADAVTTLGTGVDGAVRRVETAYDGQGNAYLVTSYDAASSGSIVNQVRRAYNGFGQVATEWQAHGGAVNTSTSPGVGYAYSEMPSGANHSRLTTVTYPGGYVLAYNYASGLDSDIGRLSSMSDSTGTLEAYGYLGLGTVVVRSHPQPDVDLTYVKRSGEGDGDGGDQYAGLDRFGRVVDQRWVDATSGTATDRFAYGYDRAGNRVYRDNRVDATFGELYMYDRLGQIASFARGTLNGTQTGFSGAANRTQDWDYDAAGNWDGVDVDGVTQSRTANAQNEITGIGSLTTPTYDANGNMTGDETGRKFVYDAWNRLVAVKTNSNALLETFAYDGLNRRVSADDGMTATNLYYSTGWQVLEEQVGGDTTNRYVWSPVYEDAMVLRDRDTDADGVPDERLWVQQDANWNVTAVVDGTGAVVERYAYDPFGAVTVLDANWATDSDDLSNVAWMHLHQGLRWNAAVTLYDNYGRWYDPELGRFTSLDPIRFEGRDVNQYRYVGNNPGSYTDPTGLVINFLVGAGVGGCIQLVSNLVNDEPWDKDLVPALAFGAVGGGILKPVTMIGQFGARGTAQIYAGTAASVGTGGYVRFGSGTPAVPAATTTREALAARFGHPLNIDEVVNTAYARRAQAGIERFHTAEYPRLSLRVRRSLTTIAGAYDERYGDFAVAYNSSARPAVIAQAMQGRFTNCAESHAANALLLRGTRFPNLRFVQPMSPDRRTGGLIPKEFCNECISNFYPNLVQSPVFRSYPAPMLGGSGTFFPNGLDPVFPEQLDPMMQNQWLLYTP